MSDVVKMIVVLTAICLASAFALTALNSGLATRIAQQEELYVRGPAVREVLAGAPNNPVADAITVTVEGREWRLYPWIADGTVQAVALETAGKGGYGGDVYVITGVDFVDDEVTGVRVTKNSETPGVGSRAANPSYLRVYHDLTFQPGQPIALKQNGGQVEAVTGATRSSTAIADGVNKAVQFVLAHREQIPQWVKEKGQ
jgi:electron transport complex protein RnfG